MNNILKWFLIALGIYIFLSAVTYFLPLEKYQNTYLNYIHAFKNKPQEHIDKQINYANRVHNGEIEYNQPIYTPKQVPEQNFTTRKPYYRRDKNNPKILHKL